MPGTPYIRNMLLLDFKTGDVNGDNVIDYVYLYGNKPDGPTGLFADNITLYVQNGATRVFTKVNLKSNSGYNARLFLGDFTMDNVQDIKVDIESGGSGGYIFSYIYSFNNDLLQELFDYEKYNSLYKYRVDYADFYKVLIGNAALGKLLTLDISMKGNDYLSQFYNGNGRLKHPLSGEVSSLNALWPAAAGEKTGGFDLLAIQRVIGIYNADTLGYVVNLLKWNGIMFALQRSFSAMDAAELTTHY